MNLPKKTFLSTCFVALSFALFAQIGVRGGITLPNQNFEQDGLDLSLDPNLGFTFAVMYEIGITDNFAIQPELAFVQKGSKTKFGGMIGDAKLRINHIDVPVLGKYKFGNESVAAYVAAGPTLGYAISGSTEENGNKESFEDDDWEGYNRFELGASAGAGVGIPVGTGQVFLDFRYLFSLSDLLDDSNVTARNKGINISIGYMADLQ